MHIGLFFGSFNPPHTGHLVIASHMIEYSDIEKIWFMVSPHNPLKVKGDLLDASARLKLVQHAVAHDPRFEASDFEFNLERPSYTINTMQQLAQKYPEHRFTLIMGGDNLHSLHLWKDYETLLDTYRIFVYRREGFDNAELADHPNVVVFDVPLLNISSTFIRKAVKKGKSIRYLVPQVVEEQITLNKYYQ
ncbi:MAG: nicotinate-nucleotide adenylyltransferase [Bacteroidia bacterium]|nr:nicotinate-nucleotide adenylyltransferase [Bacteroidia bacterium]